jgi:preprotein translocase subunit Sec61beta/cephalosporin hydroxylase
MQRPVFRVKRYAHDRYHYVVRWKMDDLWKRRYFTSRSKAEAFAADGNAGLPVTRAGRADDTVNGLTNSPVTPDDHSRSNSDLGSGLSRVVDPVYNGPKIDRYFGDHWCMHLPFAYELMREVAPRLFVELGVWKGESYFAFCQSAAENNINVRCVGVDTWQGDIHMGELDAEIREDVAEYNWRYSSFSELKPVSFTEALHNFEDGTIDLLHIDGAHTYEAVRSDFESWLPKLATNGVILFHDVVVRDRGFGVWKLWQEIARPDNSFLFEFGYGLGVWKISAVSNDDAPFIRKLFRANKSQRRDINRYYAMAAAALASWHQLQQLAEKRDARARIQIFIDRGNGYNEAASRSQPLALNSWQTVRFENLQHLPQTAPDWLRIDPVDCPAVVTIAEISLIRDRDRALIYRASTRTEFERLNLSAGLVRQFDHDQMVLIALDPDTHISVPAIVPPHEPWTLEISLRAELTPPDVLARLARTINGHNEAATARIREALDAAKQQSRILTERLAEHQTKLEAKTAVIETSRRKIAALETRAGRLAQELNSLQAAWTGVLRPNYIAALRGIASSLSEARKRSPSRWKRIIQAAQGHDERRTLARTLKMAEERVKKIKHDLRNITTFSLDAARLIREAAWLQSSTIGQLLQTGPGEAAALQAQSPVADVNESTLKALFDPDWYTRQNPAVSKSGMSPLEHFIKVGAGEMRDPHPLFDVKWYVKVNPDVAASGLNPLAHFVNRGAAEGRDPHPLFDTSWYVARYMGKENRTNPLVHFLREGAEQGLNPHPLFHTRYYEGQKTANISHAAKSSLALKNGSAPNRANRRAKSTVYAFTSICFNYVPKAAVLARTLKQHNPDVRFCLLINDWIPEKSLDGRPEFDEVITIGDLDIPNKAGWVFGQSAVELCTAVKGYFLSQLLEREDCACAFYFDPDIVIFSDLNLLIDELKDKSILLTPHLTHPESSLEAVLDNEICSMVA